MLTPELQRIFNQNTLFEGLTREQLLSFAQIVHHQNFNPQDVIVSEGEVDDTIYFIVEGSVSVMIDGHTIATLKEGDTIGNLALIDKEPRSATVKADNQLHTLVFKAADLHNLNTGPISVEQQIIMNFAKQIASYLRNTNVSTLSERKRHQAEVVQLTNFDVVTGLPNQFLLKTALASAISDYPYQMQVLYQCEVTEYKEACDALGQEMGDKFLVEVAERMSTILKPSDTLYKVGSNQLIIHSSSVTQLDQLPHDAQRILRLFATVFTVDETDIFTNAYVGVAHYPHDGKTSEALIRHAGIALDSAKVNEPNSFAFYDITLNKKVEERRALVVDLRQALIDDHFELYYQPQMQLAHHQLIGAEALIRLNHPIRGMVSPAEFIPVAEQTGMIIQLGDWIARMACTQAHLWSQLPNPIRVAINLSALQFKEKQLLHHLDYLLEHLHLNPALIELEITESTMMLNWDNTIDVLNELARRGFVIAIDDFGTGYSSLSYLRKLPIDKLKIDQSFVKDLSTDKDSQDIVRCIISLAKSLGMQTIAEGVETLEQEQFLLELGCDEGQGYLYSPPLSPDDFEHRFLNQ